MGQLVPSAKNPTAKHLAKKKLKNAKKMLKMTAEKKKHKAEQKKGVKQALKNEALKAFKEKAKKTSEKEFGHQPPLPPPNEPPPASDEAPAAPDEAPPASDEAMPSGTFRVVKEHAGMLLYGRQGAVMGMGEDQLQLLLEKDARNSIERLAWVNKSWLLEISDEEKKKSWTFPQVTLSRQIRQHILVQTGAVSEDIEDEMWISDEVELIGKEVPANGIDQMHILFGWHVLCYMASGKQFDGIPGITLLDPSISCPLALPAADQHHEPDLLQKLKQLVIQKMSKNEGTFLVPLAAGGHWSLLVIDKPSRKIRYYDSLAGSDEKADIGTIEEIKNLPERCLAMAETFLGILLDLGCIGEDVLHCPGLSRENEKCRQPWGSNQCGQFVLAYLEKEVGHMPWIEPFSLFPCAKVLEHLGYGPSPTGWPESVAWAWHQRLQKITAALRDEQPRLVKDLKDQLSKLQQKGEKDMGMNCLGIRFCIKALHFCIMQTMKLSSFAGIGGHAEASENCKE